MPQTIYDKKQQLLDELKDKESRDAFVAEHIDVGIPFQIRSLRNQRGWSQEELASKAGMKQEAISRIENPNYGKLALNTLKKLASAFDVGLIVRFAPMGDIVDWDLNLSSEKLRVPSYKDDQSLKEKKEDRPLRSEILINYQHSLQDNLLEIDFVHKSKTRKIDDEINPEPLGLNKVAK